MTKLIAKSISHKYDKKYIFKDVSIELVNDGIYILAGDNGSGKSTLLQILSSLIMPSKGTIEYEIDSQKITHNEIYQYIGFSSPYMNCFEDLTLTQNINIISREFLNKDTINKYLEEFQLKGYTNYKIKSLSSGLYQRFKLMMSVINNPKILFLDEPGTNLDKTGKSFLSDYLTRKTASSITIIATNDDNEKALGKEIIDFT